MPVEEVAGILVAVFWAILVSFLAVALARLAQTLRATTKLVADVTDQAVPLLADASAAVRSAQTQIDRVDAIASDVPGGHLERVGATTTVASTFGGPLVKVAAFGYGVRRAIGSPRTMCPQGLPSYRDRGPHRPVRATGKAKEADAAMFRRTFWFTAGAAAGVWATTKVNRKLKQLTPESLAARPRTRRSKPGTGSRTSRSTSATAWPSEKLENSARHSGSITARAARAPACRRDREQSETQQEPDVRREVDVLVEPE